ncbi:MAG: NAD-dependent epimerase/dehydratase family protein [Desulfurivibrionaceae bacterium]
MKILVTGGAGFIGSNVVDAYLDAGHEVVVMDNLFSGKWENLNPGARFYLMDIRNPEVAEVFAREKFDLVNHHAAQMSVPASVEDPLFDADVNVKGLVNLLEVSREHGVRKVIFISSGGAVYGEAEEFPTSENYPVQPLSPYAITKSVSEQYLAFYRYQYGIDYTVLRYANVYGPRQIPHGEAGVVAVFMDRLLKGKTCTVYRYPEEPKGMTRDYCYVEDIVQANLLVLDRGSAEVFNIGTGRETNTADLFLKVFQAMKALKPDIPDSLQHYETGAARSGDLRQSCLSCDKAAAELGFIPAYSLTEGLLKTAEWRLGLEA